MNRALATLTLTILTTLPLSAGVVFEIETKDLSAAHVTSTEVSVGGKNLKMEITSKEKGQEGEMIFRGDRREMVVVDHGQKTFMVLDEAAIKQIGGMASQVIKKMEEALKNVPEEQRAMVEKMMKERMGDAGATADPGSPTTEVRSTNEKATKNGYPCVKYTVHQGDRKIRELWVTDWSNIEGAAEGRGAFEDMAAFFQELLDSMPKMQGGGLVPGGAAGSNILTQMREIKGFPVAGSDFGEGGSVESEFNLRSSKRRTLDPAEFEPPTGYKRQSMPGF